MSYRIPAKLKGTFGKHMLLPALIITNFHSCSRVEGSVKFSSVPRSFPPLWSPMDCSTPSFLVHHQLPELAQTHIHRVSDAIQPSHPLSSASPTFILAHHQSFPLSQLFPTGGQSSAVSASASVLPMNIQDWFPLGLTGLTSLQYKGLSRVFSNTTVQKQQF